jgi:hypothetical protein
MTLGDAAFTAAVLVFLALVVWVDGRLKRG